MKAFTRAVIVFWFLAVIAAAIGVGVAIDAPSALIVVLAVASASGYLVLIIRDKRTRSYLWRSDERS